MSNIHATADTSGHQISSTLGTVAETTATLRATIRNFATRVVAAIEQRSTQQRLAGFSDHMLRDFGFERDWDGSVLSLHHVD